MLMLGFQLNAQSMTGIRFLISKSSRLILKTPVYQVEATVRPCFTCIGRDYSTNRSTRSSNNVDVIPPRLSNLHLQRTFPLLEASHLLNRQLYSSSAGSRGEDVAASSSSGSGVTDTSGFNGNDLVSKVKEVWNSSLDVVSQTGEKAKEVFGEGSPHVEQLLDTNPYLRDVIVPVGGTIAGTIAAWAILPRIFRRFHKYSTEGPGAFLPVGSLWGAVPYENSFWGALELPVRYLITFMAFSQMLVKLFCSCILLLLTSLKVFILIFVFILYRGMMVAPTTIASQFIGPAWRAGVIISFIWFLHRWKQNVVTRAFVTKSAKGIVDNKLLTLDKFSSVGLFVLGGMALAEACGVAVQSILTVGGIGGKFCCNVICSFPFRKLILLKRMTFHKCVIEHILSARGSTSISKMQICILKQIHFTDFEI